MMIKTPEEVLKLKAKALKHKIFVTKSARFNADSRLRATHKLANYSLMILSFYIIAISLGGQMGVQYMDFQDKGFWSAILSVLVMGIAGLEAGYNRCKVAHIMHENAVKMDSLFREMEIKSGKLTEKQLIELNHQYTSLLLSCEFNQKPIDMFAHKAQNSWLNQRERCKCKLMWLLHALHVYGIYILACILPLVLILFYK